MYLNMEYDMITYHKGDMFESDANTLTITVNTVGAMGKGIALTAKQRDPELYKKYKSMCQARIIEPGKPHLIMNKRYLLFPTKLHWHNPSRYEWIISGLTRIKINAHHLESIAIPPIGCGNGGLDWNKVSYLIEDYLSDLDLDIRVYPPNEVN